MKSLLFKLLTGVAIFIFHGRISASEPGTLRGRLLLDSSWDQTIYISHIPTFDDLYTMSSDMIISRTTIDSLGYFEFDISFFPDDINLYRIHISKKGDSAHSIIIGGKDENHLFLLATGNSNIEIEAGKGNSPFRLVRFANDSLNRSFHHITTTVKTADSIASVSETAKRQFVERKLNEELLLLADSTDNLMVALYAIYKSDTDATLRKNPAFLPDFLQRWNNNPNPYLTALARAHPIPQQNNKYWLMAFPIALAILLGFGLGRLKISKKDAVKNLSVQEKRIFEQLKKGASNQEISEEFNIGVSTVKSHVSSILSKLNLKSRKDIIHLN